MEEREDDSSESKLGSFLRKNFLIVGLLSIGLILVVVGVMQMAGSKSTEIKFEEGAEVAGSSVSKIIVDVSGAVRNPGVYELGSDARIRDALSAAGGLASVADQDYISKAVNLAQVVTDGTKIYVPHVGESAKQTSILSQGSNGIVSGTSSSATGAVSINSGSESELDTLPGIGPVTAQKIVENRPYSSVEDLLSKQAVGEATFNKIKELISL